MSGMSNSSSSSSMPPASGASVREKEVSSEEEVVQKDQQGAASSSTGKKRSWRGPSRLPSGIMPLNKRPTVKPVGDRNWYVVATDKHERQVNSIISLLLKKHFPGLVILNGKEEPGFTWAHYQAASDDKFSSKAERIKAEVWVILEWCEKHPMCWEKKVDTWCDGAWKATHSDKREERLMMEGVSHRQGSLNDSSPPGATTDVFCSHR